MSSILKVDTINEVTSANGVTVDGLSIKDSKLVTANSVVTTNVTDANITSGKIADDAVTLAKMASGTDGNIISYDASGNPVAVATGSAGQILTSAGAGAPPTFAAAAAAGITMANQFRLTSTFTGDVDPIASNLEAVDTAGQGSIGSAMTQSSGIFTFPSTGIYLVRFVALFSTDQSTDSAKNKITIKLTTNNSSYTDIAFGNAGLPLVDSTFTAMQAITESLVDVTNTSNVKVKFSIDVAQSSVYTSGNTDRNETFMTFIRLGDT